MSKVRDDGWDEALATVAKTVAGIIFFAVLVALFGCGPNPLPNYGVGLGGGALRDNNFSGADLHLMLKIAVDRDGSLQNTLPGLLVNVIALDDLGSEYFESSLDTDNGVIWIAAGKYDDEDIDGWFCETDLYHMIYHWHFYQLSGDPDWNHFEPGGFWGKWTGNNVALNKYDCRRKVFNDKYVKGKLKNKIDHEDRNNYEDYFP